MSATGGIRHYTLDHLGTPRLVTNRCGERYALFTNFPFGMEVPQPSLEDASERMRFTVHERDLGVLTDTNDDLDSMHARDYAPNLGRFLSVDLLRGDVRAPQGFNLFAYVEGNAVNYVDPFGMDDKFGEEITVPGVDPCPLAPQGMSCGEWASLLRFFYYSWLYWNQGGSGGGGGGGTPGTLPSTPMEPCSAVSPQKRAWIAAHGADAANVAKTIGVTPAEILALSALESWWGQSRFAQQGNNFFGMHAPQPGALPGTIQALNNPSVYMATYSSYLASAQSFATAYGDLVRGVTDPATFAANLQNAGAYGINNDGTKRETFVPDVVGTANGLAAALACIP